MILKNENKNLFSAAPFKNSYKDNNTLAHDSRSSSNNINVSIQLSNDLRGSKNEWMKTKNELGTFHRNYND